MVMTSSTELTDEELAQETRQGSHVAFAELIERHSARVYKVAFMITGSSHEAEDVVQETFLKAFKHIDRFDHHKASFRTWLLTIARNQSINLYNVLKRQAARILSESYDEETAAPQDNSPLAPGSSDAESTLSVRQELRRVEKAMKRLPERQRTALLLKAQEELSYDEIAKIMKTSASSVESLIFRARQKLLVLTEGDQ